VTYLSHGGFGTVMKVTKEVSKNNNRSFAVKIMPRNVRAHQGDGDSSASPALREAQLHKNLQHQHIIQFVDSFADDMSVSIDLH